MGIHRRGVAGAMRVARASLEDAYPYIQRVMLAMNQNLLYLRRWPNCTPARMPAGLPPQVPGRVRLIPKESQLYLSQIQPLSHAATAIAPIVRLP